MRNLSVCFVCHEYPPFAYGGIGKGCQIVARYLVRAGHRVRVVGLYGPNGGWPGHAQDRGVEVFRLRSPVRDCASLRARLLLHKTIAAWCRQGLVDLVEVPDGAGWAAGWPQLDAPVVTRIHGSLSYFRDEMGLTPRRWDYLVEQLSLQRADYWYSVSRYAAQRTQRIFHLPPADAVIYSTSIDPDVHSLPNGSSFRRRAPNKVVFTGTLTPKKGVNQLMRAWGLVRDQRPDAELEVFGKNLPRDNRLMSELLIDQLRARDRSSVVFHGHAPRRQLVEALTRARAAVFPSFSEAFALAPLEAMAYGCPTVYSRRSSGPELVRDRLDGLLINPDQPGEIAAALLSILNDNALAERLSRDGQRRVLDTFTTRQLMPQMIEFYRQCVAEFRKTR